MAIAAEDRVHCSFSLTPFGGRVTSEFLVAVDAGVKSIAALESNRHNIALRPVVGTMRLHSDSGAVDDHLTRKR